MSMTATQSSAFEAAAGVPPSATSTLFLGIAIGILALWGVWTYQSVYRGWASRNLDGKVAAGAAVRWTLMFMIMTYMLLH